jgi:hypothetical protein
VFDGQGYFISGLTLETTQIMSNFSSFGVFGSADHAEIRNLGVKDIDINAGDVIATRQGDLAIGGVVGYAKASVIDNCYASGSISRVYGTYYISDTNPNGGICGRASYDSTRRPAREAGQLPQRGEYLRAQNRRRHEDSDRYIGRRRRRLR